MYLLACLYSYAKSGLISILTYLLLIKLTRMALHQHIDNAIVWLGGNRVEELFDGQRGGFSGGCLFDDNRADDNQDLVIHSLSIKDKGTNDALDAFDADVVKRRT